MLDCNFCVYFGYSRCVAKFSCSLLLHVYINSLRIGCLLRKCLGSKIMTYKLIYMSDCMKYWRVKGCSELQQH